MPASRYFFTFIVFKDITPSTDWDDFFLICGICYKHSCIKTKNTVSNALFLFSFPRLNTHSLSLPLTRKNRIKQSCKATRQFSRASKLFWIKMNGKLKCIKCALCESPVFERGYNWRARQKGKNDKGELVGLSSLLIWFGDRLVWQRGKHRERERQICDVIDAHRDTAIGKIRPAGGVQASMPNQVFLDRLRI